MKLHCDTDSEHRALTRGLLVHFIMFESSSLYDPYSKGKSTLLPSAGSEFRIIHMHNINTVKQH